ncbi:NAD(P)/FAD-dependent oxidoreductase [Flexithrix dorotheae]|uniref:NAD(P)/FAD-dependent oxidoreductase n=1 Tax=Flexithrix dorotheae TaxID=70993 RepID=UPI0003755478|nr:FAD-binding oxidoreductase [Flexithrix dorotheae]
MELDYLIIGQGIAGTILSHTFIQNGKKVMVVDNGKKHISSRIAAGIFNPITGRKMVKTWYGDHLFPFFHQFYPEFENFLDCSFFHQLKVYHPFDTQEKQNDWLAAMGEPKFQDYVGGFEDGKEYQGIVKGDFGGMKVHQAGYVDISLMLDEYRKWLDKNNFLIAEEFSEREMSFEEDFIQWKDFSAKKVIFCDGTGSTKSSFFHWLPFRPVKGELLVVKLASEPICEIISRGCWVLPVGNGLYKVGATYDHSELNFSPSEKGRMILEERLQALLKIPYEIVDQKAGVRPATYDRRPFIGIHPENPKIGIFNGLGAKGISLAPYFANMFYNHLEKNDSLIMEVDIKRVLKKYFYHK